MAQDVSATSAPERMYLLCAQADLVPMGCTALLHAATNKGHRALAIACIALSAAFADSNLAFDFRSLFWIPEGQPRDALICSLGSVLGCNPCRQVRTDIHDNIMQHT